MQNSVLDPVVRKDVTAFGLVDGVELIGPYHGSGYRSAKYVVARPDGQVVQLSELLFRIASALDGRTGCGAVAHRVGGELQRPLSAADVERLVHEQLAPAGLVAGLVPADATATDGSAPDDRSGRALRPDHLLMLRFRVAVVPAGASRIVAGVFRPMHHPVAVVALLTCAVALDVVLLASGGLQAATSGALQMVQTPALLLGVLGLLMVSGIFHECGHVSACRYGGARPGSMGVGIYLVWPAFYSTVTDSYRLSRAGRLRTDLGGVYFNAVFIAGLAAAHLATGAAWLLVVIAALHLETARQFLPSIRLDGYYILSDLIGVPDLFTYLGPVLSSMLPGRDPDPRVALLRPGVQRMIRVWVLLVAPFLAFFLVSFLVMAPRVLPQVVESAGERLTGVAAGVRAGDAATVVLGLVQTSLLVLPVLGGVTLLFLMVRRLGRLLAATLFVAGRARKNPRPAVGAFTVAALPVLVLGVLWGLGTGRRPLEPGEAVLAGGTGVPAPAAEAVAQRQLAGVLALLGGPGPEALSDLARAACLVLGAAGALLLWPLCRRLGLPNRVAGLAVVLAGAAPPVALLHSVVDAGAVAAVWLVLAAVLAGRGRSGPRLALVAAGVAVLSAPVAAVGLLGFGTFAIHRGQLGRRLRPAVRWPAVGVGAVATVAVGVAVALGAPEAVPVPLSAQVSAALLAVGAVVAALTCVHRRPLAPIAVAMVLMLVMLVAVPGLRTTILLLTVPALAVLGAVVVDRAVPRDRPRPVRVAVAATVLLSLVIVTPLVSFALAPTTVPAAGPAGPLAGPAVATAPGPVPPGPVAPTAPGPVPPVPDPSLTAPSPDPSVPSVVPADCGRRDGSESGDAGPTVPGAGPDDGDTTPPADAVEGRPATSGDRNPGCGTGGS